MTLRLLVFSTIPPSLLRPFVVRRLLRRSAHAFGASPPSPRRWMWGGDLLRAYATFSNARAELLLSGHGDQLTARRELWVAADRLGSDLRALLGVRTISEAMVAARAVYGALNIDLHGSPSGDVVVARCSFSRVYAPEVCALMSSLDAGLFAGLTGGRRLTFTERITEGAPACLARLGPPRGRAA